MKATIKATCPTNYQRQSLRAFGMPIEDHHNGSSSAELEFGDYDSAEAYLTSRAEMFYDNEEELADAIDDIERYGQLTLDAVTAKIYNNNDN
jgi:hypothetical protein